MEIMEDYYGKEVMVFIDEYDTPFVEAHTGGFYDEVRGGLDYSEYFGFSIEETKELLEYYDLELNDEVKEMYDGYKMGDKEIYNPWSILNYARRKVLVPYWVNTSANTMLKQAI